ncbi:RsmE family RNA methyltransferase [Lacticaseibacillus daqingensis]|uniref:RsmE family RNA methyltransferase n=1 Tax=Lacticaseibacillus daqingensis TaxID=2486014 RepID=UPI000F77C8A7|nr:16S rRNA (uracil(1498)-N(3))-methyltransferase [Lacticaseibacillus daqingensis]
MNRFFTTQPLALGATVTLEASIQKHAVKVLRLAPPAQIELVGPEAIAYLATLQGAEPLTVTLDAVITKTVELPIATHLICAVPKADKAELICQKATELGATHISFYNSQWATAKWQPAKLAKKLARLQLIAQGAAEQSHRNRLPVVDFLPFAAILQEPAEAKLIAYEESAKLGETSVLAQTVAARPASLAVVFGPEGGISPTEVAALEAAGFTAAGLGPRILRTETAPLYLLSALSALTELMGAIH